MVEDFCNLVHTLLFGMLRRGKRDQKTISPAKLAVTSPSKEPHNYDSDDTLASTEPGDISNNDDNDLSDRSNRTDKITQRSGYQGNRTTKQSRVRLINKTLRRPLACSDAPPALQYSIPATTTDRVRLINKPLRPHLPSLHALPGLDVAPGLVREWTAEEQVPEVFDSLGFAVETGASARDHQETRLRKDAPCFVPSAAAACDSEPMYVNVSGLNQGRQCSQRLGEQHLQQRRQQNSMKRRCMSSYS